MTALAKSQADSEIAAEIARMAALLAMPSGGVMTEHLASEYVQALRPFPIWAIRDASVAFRFGRVGDGKWMPRPGELAKEVDRRVTVQQASEQRQRQERNQRQEMRRYDDIIASRTDEERQAVAAMCEAAKAKLTAAMEADSKPRGGGNVHEQTHNRYSGLARKALEQTLRQQDG